MAAQPTIVRTVSPPDQHGQGEGQQNRTPPPKLRHGLIGGLRVFLFGEKQEELGVTDHGAWVRKVARALSLPLMFLFSFGALMQLAGNAIRADVRTYQLHGIGALDPVSVFQTFIILALIFGMDIVMIKHAFSWRDKSSLNKPFGECVGDAFYVLFIGAIEGITFGMMLANQEHPHDLGAWLMVIFRAAAAPVVAIDLSMTGERVPTKDEMKTSLAVEVGGAMKTIFQNIRLGQLGLKDLPVLYPLFGHLLGGYTDKDKQSDDILMQRINAVMPGAVESMARQEVENAKREARDEIERIQRQIQQQQAESARKVPAAILAVLGTGEWPEWVTLEFPELAGMDMAKMFKGSRKPSASQGLPGVQRKPRDELGALLAALSVDPERVKDLWKKAPSGEKLTTKARGIWVTTEDVAKLSDGTLPDDYVSSTISSQGQGYKFGTMYAAPARAVIQSLGSLGKLHPSLLDWFSRQQSKGQGDDKGEDNRQEA